MKSLKPAEWQGYTPATPDAEALQLTAQKFGLPVEELELLRTGGAVLVRPRKEKENERD